MVYLCARIIKYLETMLSEIHYKSCFVSLDAIFRLWTKCLVEKWHFLKDNFSDPVVRPERAIRGFVESLPFSIMMTREAEGHDPFWLRPFRLFVIRPYYFYLATEDRNFRPLLYRGGDLLQPILSRVTSSSVKTTMSLSSHSLKALFSAQFFPGRASFKYERGNFAAYSVAISCVLSVELLSMTTMLQSIPSRSTRVIASNVSPNTFALL